MAGRMGCDTMRCDARSQRAQPDARTVSVPAGIRICSGKAIIKLDQPDFSFTKGWLCAYDDGTTTGHPTAKSEDGITWEISDIGFTPKDPEQHYRDW